MEFKITTITSLFAWFYHLIISRIIPLVSLMDYLTALSVSLNAVAVILPPIHLLTMLIHVDMTLPILVLIVISKLLTQWDHGWSYQPPLHQSLAWPNALHKCKETAVTMDDRDYSYRIFSLTYSFPMLSFNCLLSISLVFHGYFIIIWLISSFLPFRKEFEVFTMKRILFSLIFWRLFFVVFVFF